MHCDQLTPEQTEAGPRVTTREGSPKQRRDKSASIPLLILYFYFLMSRTDRNRTNCNRWIQHAFTGLSKVEESYGTVKVAADVLHAAMKVGSLSTEQRYPFKDIDYIACLHLTEHGLGQSSAKTSATHSSQPSLPYLAVNSGVR